MKGKGATKLNELAPLETPKPRRKVDKFHQSPAGFTVVETMIFLTVSSILFVGAIVMVGGWQRSTEFAQSVRDVDTRIRDVINDVSSGFYPRTTSFQCSVTNQNDPTSPPVLAVGTNTQGTNDQCVFMGKIIQFTHTKLNILTVIGRRQTPNGSGSFRLATVLNELRPVAAVQSGVIDLTEHSTIEWGVRAYKMVYNSSISTGALGFFSTFGQYANGSSDPLSGAQQVNVVTVSGTSLDTASDVFPTTINNTSIIVNPPGGVVICLREPGGNKKASITIGANNRQLTTNLLIDQRDTSICP